jgi:hypothetical protein
VAAVERSPAESRAARQLDTAAAILAFSVLTDSAAEHYRAGFHNRAMFIAPIVSAGVLATTSSAACRQHMSAPLRRSVLSTAVLTGLAGFGFHLANIPRRTGGWTSPNVLFGAPVAAPLAVTMAGLLGLASDRVRSRAPARGRLATGICVLSALGLVGTSIEAGALHFRGAFQNPFMYAPVTVPPIAAAALGNAALAPSPSKRRVADTVLRLTSLLGIVGVGLHAWGVHRRMGGWHNWRQNLLAGPPLPAPPAFSGLAVAGLAALNLLDAERVR